MSTVVLGQSAFTASFRAARSGLRGWLAPGLLHAAIRDSRDGVVHLHERGLDTVGNAWVRRDLISNDAVGPVALVVHDETLHALVPEAGGVAHLVRPVAPLDAPTGRPESWTRLPGQLDGHSVTVASTEDGLVAATGGASGVDVWRFADQAWTKDVTIAGTTAGTIATDAMVVERGGLLEWWWRDGAWTRAGIIGRAGTAPVALIDDGNGWLLAVPRRDTVETWHLDRDGHAAPGPILAGGADTVDAVALARTPVVGVTRRHLTALHALTVEGGSVVHHRRHTRDAFWTPVETLPVTDLGTGTNSSLWTDAVRAAS